MEGGGEEVGEEGGVGEVKEKGREVGVGCWGVEDEEEEEGAEGKTKGGGRREARGCWLSRVYPAEEQV